MIFDILIRQLKLTAIDVRIIQLKLTAIDN